jgi:hypothetical protein
MPTHQGLGADDRDGPEDRWEPSIQLDEEEAISVAEVNTTTHLPPQDDQLTSECHVLCLKSALRLGETRRVSKKQSSEIIDADVRRFSYLINTDEVFGTHRRMIRSAPTPAAINSGPGLATGRGRAVDDRFPR